MSLRIVFSDAPVFGAKTICCFALSFLFTSIVQARPIVVDETINNGAIPEEFIIGQGATLTVNDASTLNISSNGSQLVVNTGALQDIRANNGSTVTLNNATVVARANQPGVTITNSNATITDSTITSSSTGLQVARIPRFPLDTTVSLIGSSVTGGATGAVVSAQTTLNMRNADLTATGSTGVGLRLASGDAFALGGSIVGGQNGVLLSGDNFIDRANTLVLDGTRVEGGNGAAIAVDATGRSIATNVHVLNGARLTGGNGNLLEVANAGTVNLTVDNSVLEGNIKVATGAVSNVVVQNNSYFAGNLQNVATVKVNNQSLLKGDVLNDVAGASSVVLDNGSTLEGNISNSSRVAIDNQAQWIMTRNNQVNALALNGGTVRFGSGDVFRRLEVVNLSGNGVFAMGANFVANTSDYLDVIGTATGNHQLLVAASANDPGSGVPVKVGNVRTGDAVITLVNDSIDSGAYTYRLLREGEGLYLAPDKETVSTGTNTVLAIAGTAPTIMRAEMTTLNSRLGDRRMSGTEPSISARSAGESPTGVWVRTYGNQYRVANSYGDGYSQRQQGISVGADAPLPIGDGEWLVGGFLGSSKTDLDLKQGSNATIDSYYLGGYLTKYNAATGYYLDMVTKINQFDNSAKVTMSDGTRTQGDYKTLGLSGSVEVGKHIPFDNGIFVAPFTQVAAAVAKGKDYTLDNGLRVSNDNARSLIGTVGTTVGREITLGNGARLQPRVKIAIAHEFVKTNVVSVNGNYFDNDTSTTNLELGAGINLIPARKSWQVYSEVSSSKGKTMTQDWNASIGLSYNF